MESHQAELDRSVKAQIETQERAQAQQKLEAELVERQRAGEEAAAVPFVAIGFDTASAICDVKQAAQVPCSPLPRIRSVSAPVPLDSSFSFRFRLYQLNTKYDLAITKLLGATEPRFLTRVRCRLLSVAGLVRATSVIDKPCMPNI